MSLLAEVVGEEHLSNVSSIFVTKGDVAAIGRPSIGHEGRVGGVERCSREVTERRYSDVGRLHQLSRLLMPQIEVTTLQKRQETSIRGKGERVASTGFAGEPFDLTPIGAHTEQMPVIGEDERLAIRRPNGFRDTSSRTFLELLL